MSTLVIVILLLFFFGGGGYYGHRSGNWNMGGGISLGGVVLVLVLWWLFIGH